MQFLLNIKLDTSENYICFRTYEFAYIKKLFFIALSHV